MKKGIIFDIGNVIQPWTWARAEEEFSKSPAIPFRVLKADYKSAVTKGEHWNLYERGKIGPGEFAKQVLKNMGMDPSAENSLFFSASMESLFGDPRGDVIDLIKRLNPKIKKALLSNSCPELESIAKSFNGSRLGYFDLFEEAHIYLSHKTQVKKPDEEAYRITVEGLRLKPHDCLFIDNKKRNIDAAKKFGMKGVLYTNVEELGRVLKPYLV